MSRTVNLSSFAAVLALSAGSAFGQAFVGNLAVSQLGRRADGTAPAALTNAAQTVSIRDYSASVTAAALNQTYYFNDSANGTRLTMSGTATSSGYLRNSANNQFLTIAGWDAAQGTATITATAVASVNKVVGRLNVATGAIEYTRISDAYNADNIRSVVSVDGSSYWLGGTSNTAGTTGVRFVAHDTVTPQTSTQLSTSVTNVRNVDIFNNQLYVSSSSGAFNGVNTVGSGLPTTTGNTITNLAGHDTFDTSLSSFDYFFASSNILYVADDRTTGNGGLQKWTLSSGTWTLNWVLRALDQDNNTATPDLNLGIRGLTGQVLADGSVSLFAVTGESAGQNFLVGFSDLLTGTTIPGGSKFNLLDTSATNTIFRGVDIIPAPSAAALIALGGLVAGRRRRN